MKKPLPELKNGTFFTFPTTQENDLFMKVNKGFIRIPNRMFNSSASVMGWRNEKYKDTKSYQILDIEDVLKRIRIVK